MTVRSEILMLMRAFDRLILATAAVVVAAAVAYPALTAVVSKW